MRLEHVVGLGVAGNFTGHLEQAGEDSDFVGIEVREANAPKGIFPFYVPGKGDHFLHTYPLCNDVIRRPDAREKLQIEPELGLLCEIEYEGESVVAVVPRRFGAHNDCSIRRPGARKISEKKNWGECSKGVSATLIEIDRFESGGILDHYRLVSYLERGGKLERYGVDSGVPGYSYFYDQLLDWLVERMNQQLDEGPLESISDWLEAAQRPREALISIGATRYTEYGESTFLEPGDVSIVVVYDARLYDEATIRDRIAIGEAESCEGVSILRQRVE